MIRGSILDYVNIVTFMGKGYDTLLPEGISLMTSNYRIPCFKKMKPKVKAQSTFFLGQEILFR